MPHSISSTFQALPTFSLLALDFYLTTIILPISSESPLPDKFYSFSLQ